LVLHRTAAGRLVFVWLALPALLLWLSNPLLWQRYYIGLYPPLAILMGAGVLAIEQTVRRHRPHLTSQEAPPLQRRTGAAGRGASVSAGSAALRAGGMGW
jgi:hypothetical protein